MVYRVRQNFRAINRLNQINIIIRIHTYNVNAIFCKV